MSEINNSNVKDFLKTLNFDLKAGEENTYFKRYENHNNYEIKIILSKDSKNSKINYGKEIRKDRETTCNFSDKENFVVLECVNRLLEKGYSPTKLYLEKNYRTGRKEGKGIYLDILVLDKEENPFLMIECKTFENKEFEKEKKELRNNGGQLFSYFKNEDKRTTKYLCLYSFNFKENKEEYELIVINKKIFENNEKSFFENWDKKILNSKGIFDKNAKPYLINFEKVVNLKNINETISKGLYNKFAEILRKNAISDKTNSYNKIFNLLLCKVVDEDKNENKEERSFEFKPEDSYISFLGRLNDLYKEGIEDYLRLDVTDYSEEEIENELKIYLGNKDYSKLKEMYNEIRLYKNNEFSFIDVYNKDTFERNALIVKEIVELFQNLKLRYKEKHQFLGDFFEELLHTGIKQEEGQFFTPTPLTSFISKSLPLKKIIENKKSDEKEKSILPFVIDHACGSGHFLTEIMSEIQFYVDNMTLETIKGGRQAREDFKSLKENFKWAEKYIYGIDKDYRLTKTAKISTLLNGDGLANVFCDDGLNQFHRYKKTYGILYKEEEKENKDNPVFDVVVANPPFAVKDFKDSIELFGKETFDLWPYLEKGRIESFFIERTKQLLKVKGVCGIVLPVSILSKTGLYTKTRELILKYFKIKGIVKLGGDKKIFMETGTHTIILFLERIENNKNIFIKNLLYESFENKRDNSINNIENPINRYLEKTYESNFEDFKTLLNLEPNKNFKSLEIFKEYEIYFNHLTETKKLKNKKDFKEKTKEEQNKILDEELYKLIIEKEKEKIFYFIILYKQKIILINLPEDNKEKEEFLGYKFSGRKQNEGIKLNKDENHKLITKLFNEYDLEDKTKLNYYILKNFENMNLKEVDESLKENVFIQNLNSLIDFENISFEKKINLNPKIEIESKYQMVKLKNLIKEEIGEKVVESEEDYLEIGDVDINKKTYDLNKKTKKTIEGAIKVPKNTLLISKVRPTRGAITITKKKINVSTAFFKIKLENKYIYHILNQDLFFQYLGTKSDTSQQYPTCKDEDIFNFKIPLPSIEIQNKIINEIEENENKITNLENENMRNEIKIKEILEENSDKKEIIKNILDEINGERKKIKKGQISSKGKSKVFSQEGFIGYSNLEPIKKENLPLIIFGDHNKKFFFIEEQFVIGADGVVLLKPKKEIINEIIFYHILKNLKIESYQSYQRHFSTLKDIVVKYPSIHIQNKIVNEINKIEEKINKNKDEIKKLKLNKNEILDKYLK